MLIEDLFRVLIDSTIVFIYDIKGEKYLWHGRVVNIPICYFDKVIKNIYTRTTNIGSSIVINIE